jgi:hypothetical protein
VPDRFGEFTMLVAGREERGKEGGEEGQEQE